MLETKSALESELQLKLEEYHDLKYGNRIGSVYQIWEDGEITSQKSGDLLWHRTLHPIRDGIRGVEIPMPEKFNPLHSYAMVKGWDQAWELRLLIDKLYNLSRGHE